MTYFLPSHYLRTAMLDGEMDVLLQVITERPLKHVLADTSIKHVGIAFQPEMSNLYMLADVPADAQTEMQREIKRHPQSAAENHKTWQNMEDDEQRLAAYRAVVDDALIGGEPLRYRYLLSWSGDDARDIFLSALQYRLFKRDTANPLQFSCLDEWGRPSTVKFDANAQAESWQSPERWPDDTGPFSAKLKAVGVFPHGPY